MHNHSYENEFNLHVNKMSFSFERMSTKTRFEKDAKGNSEMAYSVVIFKNFMSYFYSVNIYMRATGFSVITILCYPR